MSEEQSSESGDRREQPKTDRLGNDFNKGTNPAPGGQTDTGGSAVPPYEDRSTERAEQAKGTARAWGSEPPAKEPEHPGQEETPADARMAPEGVGESMTRGGEEVAGQDGKEPGREDTGTKGPSGRPTGTSTTRDSTDVGTDEASGEAAPQAP
ncbi:MAG TPA: hypothetical protein VN601_07555 [Arthrobacter sp.]|nr:hypothetical protein [Arthrobacter sp.]